MNEVTVVPKGTEEMTIDKVKTCNKCNKDILNKCVDEKKNVTSNMHQQYNY